MKKPSGNDPYQEMRALLGTEQGPVVDVPRRREPPAALRLELRAVDPQTGRFHVVSVDVLQTWLLETPPDEVARRALVPALVALQAEVQREPLEPAWTMPEPRQPLE